MTPDAVLTRLDWGDQGVFGRLVAGPVWLYSGELPWRDNRPGASCVPCGAYGCAWTWSPRFGRRLYLLHPVAGRTGIRAHPANLMGDAALGFRSQLNGCVALGERLGWIDGQKAVLLSAPAVRRLEDLMQRRPFTLEVRDGR